MVQADFVIAIAVGMLASVLSLLFMKVSRVRVTELGVGSEAWLMMADWRCQQYTGDANHGMLGPSTPPGPLYPSTMAARP